MSEHRDDDAVEARIGHEGVGDLAVEDERDEAGDDQDDDHPPQIDLRAASLYGSYSRARALLKRSKLVPFLRRLESYRDLSAERNGKIAAVPGELGWRVGVARRGKEGARG